MPAASSGDPLHESAPDPLGTRPQVSVVVPIYNVERYLTECLESLAHQSLPDIEVVMVDDGSTDSSAVIAAEFAEQDDRFRLVRQPNGGLGNARNTGTEHARGTYLAFVDSDDLVTPRAYELLAGSLEKTGSDFATGNFHRLTNAGTRQAGMVFSTYNAYRPRTHVRTHPALLNDRTAWNKLFRRTFWDENSFRWPEGVLYEDIPVTLRAHVLASAVDVIRHPVYLWRARSGAAASITQRRAEPRAVEDRVAAVDGISRFMAERGETPLKKLYDKSVAAQDLRYFLQSMTRGDVAFQERFLQLANDFFDRASPDVFDDLPALQRLQWHLVRRRLLPELLEVVHFENSGEASLTPFVRRHRKVYGDYPYRGDPALAIPDHIYRLRRDEIPVRAKVEDVWWDGDNLRLSGYGHIAFLPLATERAGRIRLTLEESGHPDSVVQLRVRRIHRPDLTAASPDGVTNYDWSGWEATLPISQLQHAGGFRPGSWRLRIEVRASGVKRRRWVTRTGHGRSRSPAILVLGSTRITPTTPAGDFAVVVSTQHAQVERAYVEDDVLELSGTLHGRGFDPVTATLRLARLDGTASFLVPVSADVPDADGDRTFLTRVDLRQVRAHASGKHTAQRQIEDRFDGGLWEPTLLPDSSGARVHLVAATDLPQPRSRKSESEVAVQVSRIGRLRIVERTVRPEIDEIIGEPPGPMEFRGRSWAPAERPRDPFLRTSLDLVLSPSGRVVSVAVPLVHEQGRFSVKMDPEAIPTLAGDVPLTTGLWKFYLRAGPDGELLRVRVAPEALQQLPRRSPEGARAMSLFASETGNLSFNVRPPVSQAALSRAGQKRLRAGVYAPAIQQHVLDQVLVDGYADGRYGDDVREIVEGLTSRAAGSDIVWTTDDGLTPRPDGVRCVTRYSREWHEAVARSRHVVMTDRLGLGELEGRDDQTVLQVWHGVPVRPFGLRDETRHGRADLRRETARWDMVLSTGPAHSKVLRDDFGVEHAVETGLPRHDLLVDPERAEERARRAAQTRVRLGLSADARVVLWAPTHLLQQVRPGQYLLEWPMDPATLDDALGDDHVLVVRRHPKTSCLRVAEAESVDSEVPESDVAIRTSRVVDASLLPDVRDLLLCADVLVTDRSSLLVDRALTGKPSVFFLHGQAGEDGHIPISALPGRVVTEAAALVEAIHAATDEEPAHAKARESLLDTWVPRRDGRATDRVLDALLLRQDPPGKTHGAGGTAGSSTTTALDVS